ncbi:MAG: hypothetical protein EXQ67_00830 [Thermoleophilia bacterium]|nr:hypothetical protein [Thermoleophilia bacterium]
MRFSRRNGPTVGVIAQTLPEVARALARCCAAGLPIADAFERAADAVDEVVVDLLRTCAAGLRSGAATRSALAPLLAVPGGSVLVGTIELHQELGGDLVASLAAVAEGLADRERLRLEAEVATAQARLAARIVPLAPVVSLGFLTVLAPSALAALFTTGPGLVIIGVAAGLTGIALLLLRRIARAVGL